MPDTELLVTTLKYFEPGPYKSGYLYSSIDDSLTANPDLIRTIGDGMLYNKSYVLYHYWTGGGAEYNIQNIADKIDLTGKIIVVDSFTIRMIGNYQKVAPHQPGYSGVYAIAGRFSGRPNYGATNFEIHYDGTVESSWGDSMEESGDYDYSKTFTFINNEYSEGGHSLFRITDFTEGKISIVMSLGAGQEHWDADPPEPPGQNKMYCDQIKCYVTWHEAYPHTGTYEYLGEHPFAPYSYYKLYGSVTGAKDRYCLCSLLWRMKLAGEDWGRWVGMVPISYPTSDPEIFSHIEYFPHGATVQYKAGGGHDVISVYGEVVEFTVPSKNAKTENIKAEKRDELATIRLYGKLKEPDF